MLASEFKHLPDLLFYHIKYLGHWLVRD